MICFSNLIRGWMNNSQKDSYPDMQCIMHHGLLKKKKQQGCRKREIHYNFGGRFGKYETVTTEKI